jgi:hypothetical protein
LSGEIAASVVAAVSAAQAEAIDTSTFGVQGATRCPQRVESKVSVEAAVSAAILGYAQAARLPLQFGNINFYTIWNFLLDLGFRNCSGSASTAGVLLNTKQPTKQRRD